MNSGLAGRPPVLDYAVPGADGPNRPSYPIGAAKLCGAVPLTVGVGVTLLTAITGSLAAGAVGLLVLAVGPVLFLVGMGCLWTHDSATRRLPPERRVFVSRGRGTALALLLLCWPVAAVCLVVGAATVELYPSRATLTVRNAATVPLRSITITGFDRSPAPMGPIAPGESHSVDIRHSGGGTVRYVADLGGKQLGGTLYAWGDDDARMYDFHDGQLWITVAADDVSSR